MPQPTRLLCLALLLLAGVARAQVSAPAKHPNVIVILTDDQGYGDLSLHGNSNLATPNLDQLARDGARFEQFLVCPVCSPTRAEFLTGRYHPRGGVYSTSAGGERLDLDEHTIAETFRAAGYATGAFGKWHNGMQYPYHPNGRGFDEFYGFCSGHWALYFDPMLERNGKIVRGKGYLTDDLTDRAMAFITTQVRAKRPFFCYVPYNTPHSPMQVPDRYWRRFAKKKLTQRGRPSNREDIPHTRAALAMCENIDSNVGRLLAQVDELGIAKDTIVVFFHDNGPNGVRFNGGLRGRKGSTDDGGVRSPLFLRWPGTIPAGKTIRNVSGAIDLLPTLAALAGIELRAQKPLDGRSLKPLLLETKSEAWPERTLFSHWRGRVSARTDRYRLDARGRLYDMDEDPGQRQDLATARPKVATRLREAVAQFRRQVLPKGWRTKRPFTLGHPDCVHTQLPARDATPHGGIRRSNRFPNCSHFTNWKTTDDHITWDVEVPAAGTFAVDLYYTCPKADLGARVQLELGEQKLAATIRKAFDPPYIGAQHDRVPRKEGDEKRWQSLRLGQIHLAKGKGTLTLRALEIPGAAAMDFRLLMFERLLK